MRSEVQIVFRAMKEDPNGKPLTGRSARTLGVRICGPRIDTPIRAGKVHPQTGGMSVAPDDPMRLPPMRLPKSLGGEGRDPVFYLQVPNLSPALNLRRDTPTHALIEPAQCCLFEEFERNLHDTKEKWAKYE